MKLESLKGFKDSQIVYGEKYTSIRIQILIFGKGLTETVKYKKKIDDIIFKNVLLYNHLANFNQTEMDLNERPYAKGMRFFSNQCAGINIFSFKKRFLR